MKLPTFGNKLGVRSNINIIRDGVRIPVLKDQRNLILDTGMEDIGQRSLSNFQDYCHWGDGSDSNTLDSGAITASQSGTTVTASAGIFSAGDVGALIKFDSGEEKYITTFTSSTVVEVSDSATVASSEFTIWYVDQTTLANEIQRTNSTQGTNNFSESGGVITRTRTHIFSAIGSAQTVREVGWGHENNTTIASRVVLGSPVALSSGDQLEVESFFEIVQSPQTPQATDPTGDEGSFAGNFQIEGYGIGTLDGETDRALEPYASGSSCSCKLSSTSTALGTYGTPVSISFLSGGINSTPVLSSLPTTAPWQITKTWSYTTGQGNGTIRSVVITDFVPSLSALRLLLTSGQVKTSDQTISVQMTVTWDRNLTN